MKNVTVRSETIATSIIAEQASIREVGPVIQDIRRMENGLIREALQHSALLAQERVSLSEEQIHAIATQIHRAMKEIERETDSHKRKNIVATTLEAIKGIAGTTVSVMESFFKLASLLGTP